MFLEVPIILKSVNDLTSIFNETEALKITNLFTNAYRNGFQFDNEFYYLTANKNKKWLRIVTDEVTKNKDGFQVTGAIQDITELNLTGAKS